MHDRAAWHHQDMDDALEEECDGGEEHDEYEDSGEGRAEETMEDVPVSTSKVSSSGAAKMSKVLLHH